MSVFLTQLIFGLSEVPAHILSIWLLEVVGRKVSLVATLLTGGVSVLAILAVPAGRLASRSSPLCFLTFCPSADGFSVHLLIFLFRSVQDHVVAVTLLVTAGRIFLNWAGSVCSVYVQELFPTSFR